MGLEDWVQPARLPSPKSSVMESGGRLVGLLSLCALLEHPIDPLTSERDLLTSIFATDGAGGD